MKLFLGSLLALAIAGSPFVARQQAQDDKDKPKQDEAKAKPKPEEKSKQAAPEDKAKSKQEPEAKPEKKPQPKADKERQKQDERQHPEANRPAPERQNAPQAAEREQAPGGHGRGQRIPEERYRAAFGREHRFHVRHQEQRFQYGGYWFEVVEPWPTAWVADDDCYLEEDGDEYFLVDLLHPNLRVEVIVVQG